ncbi:hypothetical protein BD626DRAFT_571106 [Schizophyllum amplum]|uniref:Nephrocystin 3-like N-terminal domain-containing protein n=1 Tax=Schizophyllum amplum TaxID=97359 RepID=A0A550C8G9_9AGAR|nr:hypothetical protein BD626DRAFT_571106 [Auriculariopsis ampla]
MPTTENVKRSADPVSLYTIRYVSGDDLPQIPKTSRKKKHYRRIYATFGLVGGDSKLCELVPGTIVDLYGLSIGSLSASDMPVSVVLNSNQQRLDRPPILKLNLTVEHVGDADATALTSSMSLSESWATTARYIRLLVTLGSIPAEVNPIAKAVLALLKVGTEELEKRIRYNDAIVSLIDKMGEASKCVLSLEDHQFDDQRERQREACDVLILEVYRCLSFIRSLLHGKIIERLSTKNWEQSQELLKGLQSVMHDVAMKGSLDSQTAIFRTERLAWNIVGKVGQGVLNHLPYSEDAQAGSTQSCLPGTRVDLLRDIEEWAFDPDRQRGLLLYGAAGKGKSAVAHAVAKRLKEVGALAPFFAFDRTSRNRQAFQMIPTLAMQLACRDKQYRDRLCKLGIDELSTHDLKDQLDCLILELLGDHCGLVPLVFVIDALDECPDWDATDDGRSQKLAQDRRTLLESIRTCISTEGLPFNIRFFITTRPDSDIWDCLASSTTATVQMLPIDEVADTEQDIRLFVHDKLARTAVSNMVEEVVVAAQALFECAALLCRELTRVNRPRIVASRSDLVTRVMRAPGQALYTTYLAVLESHFDTSDETTMASYRRLLAWILLVQSPQRRVVFLDFARVLSPDVDMGDIFSGLSSLLTGTVDDGDQLVRPLHTSFRDFVLDVNASGSYAVDLHSASRVDLADACFQILNRELRFNICQLPTSFVLNDDIDELCGRVAKHVSPGLQYAARAAAGHLRQSTDTQPGIVQPRILDAVILFLEKKFLFWLEVCSCLRLPFGRTTSELQNLLAWTKMHQESELELLVMDFLRFDNRFREGVIMSAPQVYLSGLAFVPRGSHIHRLYGHPFGRLIQVSGHAPERDWPAGEPIVIHMQAGVNAVAYSCDGRQIASGSDNHTVEVWDAVTGQQIGEAFTGHDRRVNTVRFSPDNKRIASGSDDHTVRIWDAVTGEQIGEPFRGHEDRVCSVAYSPDGKRIASSSGDRTIRFWDPENGQQLGRLFGGHTDDVHSIAYSPNGNTIASASHDGTVQMWDALTGEQLGEPL